jgi:hypothetical protein
MTPVLIHAYRQMLMTHKRCSVDRILEYPELCSEFLALVRPAVSDRAEGDMVGHDGSHPAAQASSSIRPIPSQAPDRPGGEFFTEGMAG